MACIEVKNLTKKFKEFVAVDGISFSVEQGETFAFLGPNGAGKTTTIKMMTTLLKPSEGTLMLNGYDPLHDQNKVRSSFGIVFQDQSLDDELTAYENMDLHGRLYGVPADLLTQRIEELLRFVELWDRRNDMVKFFSGGMKRRLEIVRALVHHPKILFLDEPTLGLDPQTRNHIWEHIKNLIRTEGLTVFLTTHYMEEADRVAQTVAIIDHGKIIIQGTPQELKKQAGKETLEEVFLSVTGKNLRSEAAGSIDQLRLGKKMWGR